MPIGDTQELFPGKAVGIDPPAPLQVAIAAEETVFDRVLDHADAFIHKAFHGGEGRKVVEQFLPFES